MRLWALYAEHEKGHVQIRTKGQHGRKGEERSEDEITDVTRLQRN